MSLILERIERIRQQAGKRIARCPACAENGDDRSGEHLVILADGRFGCVTHAGDRAHRSRIFELAGGATPMRTSIPIAQKVVPRGKPSLPSLVYPSVSDLASIATARGFPLFAGLELAAQGGHLFTAVMSDDGQPVRVWLITDSARRNAQARRMDGKLWGGIDAKAKTLRGSEASWPIGAADIGTKPAVAFTEGGPDFLAAYFLAWWHGRNDEVAPVAMLGAGQRIHSDALPLFAGKQVLIFPHSDDAGRKARDVWTDQLRGVGAVVSDFDCSPHKDLNELVASCAKQLEQEVET